MCIRDRLKNGMKKAGNIIGEELKKNSKQISSKEEIAQVANIAAQDNEVWEIIAEAMDKVGNNWVITVEDGQTFWLNVEITKWMDFDQWYLSPYMVDDTEKMTATLSNAPILITDSKISNMKELLPLLEHLMQSGKKDLVIIADDIDWEALTTIILNKLKWVLNVLAVKIPWFGDNKKSMVKDIAILTWANVITAELWMKLENITPEDLGSAKKIISNKNRTTIIWGTGKDSDIDARVAELKQAIGNTE